MDLLACDECGHRFYVAGAAPDDNRACSHCGGSLTVALHAVSSIPLDARSLNPGGGLGGRPEITMVELRRKRHGDRRGGDEIVGRLAEYFAVQSRDGSVTVSVNRGAPADAAVRVAAVLDGVDSDWEEHFYLPTADSDDPADRPRIQPGAVLGQLRRLGSRASGGPAEDPV